MQKTFCITLLHKASIGALCAVALYLTLLYPGQAVGQIDMSEEEPLVDPGAMLFVNKCLQCHPGTLTGTELINTHSRPVENLDGTVRRMQQYTGPMTEDQIQQLVELMKDETFRMRVEEAKLNAELAPAPDAEALAASDDMAAKLYVSKCASCHTIGGTGSSGGDLAKTAVWQIPQLKVAIKRMELRVGPLADEEVTMLAELLKDPKVRDRLTAAGLPQPAAPSATPEAASGASAASSGSVGSEVLGRKILTTKPPPAPAEMPMWFLIGFTIFAVMSVVVGVILTKRILRNEA